MRKKIHQIDTEDNSFNKVRRETRVSWVMPANISIKETIDLHKHAHIQDCLPYLKLHKMHCEKCKI